MLIQVTKARHGYKATAKTGEWAVAPTLDTLTTKFVDEYADQLTLGGINKLTFVYNLNL